MGKFGLLHQDIRKNASIIAAIAAAVITSFGITACSSDDTVAPYNGLNASMGTPEFQQNYMNLFYLYIDKDKYLRNPTSYLGRVDTEAMLDRGIPWDYHDIYYMYAQMNDLYTYYVDPSRAKSLLSTWMSSEQKIDAGFELDSAYIPEKYVVKKVIEKSPADIAGIKAGDEIVEIEGVSPISSTVFDRLSVASEGDVITYTIKRDSTNKTIPVTIEPYSLPTVELSFKDSIPVIKINEFVQETSNDSGTFGEFVHYLHETEKYKTTIIDLRNNGGGDVSQCIAMSQLLLSKGDTAIGILSMVPDTLRKKQASKTTFYINEHDGIFKDRYFVFLANENTASCSEIMIASVVSNKKYPVVGSVTYGKGIGQTSFYTRSYALVSITSMKTIDKHGESYHKYGIVPDFAILDDAIALDKAIALAKEQNYVRVAGYGTTNTGHFAKAAMEPDTMPGFFHFSKEYSADIKLKY
ncbi:S41 family peptidase [Fibrobacter sp. UWB11]|uniref:S41 family peptidase n=1 Tax=Fibrobacter sp. UWB11 TaxID=1896202 RepID=UPI00092A912D|nr:S41 family peptidase [Fibrobacter sp. UWB11]SIO27681.1 C-terminal peptidase (prc) [Fibrobacter sp. UWB11]